MFLDPSLNEAKPLDPGLDQTLNLPVDQPQDKLLDLRPPRPWICPWSHYISKLCACNTDLDLFLDWILTLDQPSDLPLDLCPWIGTRICH